MFLLVLQRISYEFLFHILFFPVWWYTIGMKRALFKMWSWITFANAYMAPGLWIKNLFVPMYGQHDFQGRVASFFIRLGNIIVRAIGLLVCTIVSLAIFFIWPLIPMFIIYMMLISLNII